MMLWNTLYCSLRDSKTEENKHKSNSVQNYILQIKCPFDCLSLQVSFYEQLKGEEKAGRESATNKTKQGNNKTEKLKQNKINYIHKTQRQFDMGQKRQQVLAVMLYIVSRYSHTPTT